LTYTIFEQQLSQTKCFDWFFKIAIAFKTPNFLIPSNWLH